MKNKKHTYLNFKNYTFLLLVTGLLGVHILSIDLGFIQLSPYRILLLISPFVILKTKKQTLSQLKNSKNYGYFLFLLIWAFYSILPLFWIEDINAWAKMYIFLICGLITTWFIGLYLSSKGDIFKALKLVEIISIIFGAIAIYEILTGNYLFLNEGSLGYYQERSQLYSTIGFRVPISVFSNPNNYALFLLFPIFGSFGLSKIKKTKIGRFTSKILTFIFIFLLISTQSRAGFIGLLLGFVAYILVFLKRADAKNIFKSILIVLIVLFFVVPWFIENKKLFEALMAIDLNSSSGSDATRINLIKNGLYFLENSFFLGVGLGNIEYHMSHYGIYSTGSITNIHNWWMEILVSSGIFVFIFYMFVYLKNLKRLYKFSSLKFDKDMQHLSTVFFCFLAAFFIASVGSSSLMYNEWIWPIMAIVMTFINLYTRQRKSN